MFSVDTFDLCDTRVYGSFIQVLALLFELEQEDREGQHNQREQDHRKVRVSVDAPGVMCEGHKAPDGTRDHQQGVNEIALQEH